MVKRKTTNNASKKTSKGDTKVAAIVIGLFAAAIILFFIFSKSKESPKEYTSAPSEPVETAVPVEHHKPVAVEPEVESSPALQPVSAEPLENVSGTGGKIAFIIDDWGQTTANCKYLKEIPEPMAVSILPGLRHTKDVANCASLYHKVAMLHLPLEAMHNNDYYPPNYIIRTTMNAALVSKIVEDDLDQLPSIEGVNNHMGSKATADKTLMKIIFKKIRKKGLFFVDSMTSHYSVSAALAGEMGLSYGKRDVFLDNINTREAITKQIMVLAQKARHRGYAVAIGHDRHLTMQVLKDEIPLLERQGFEIVSIKSLLKNK
jgi:polysaccharide deacetylase 2 family uncharacterized protein YibQ